MKADDDSDLAAASGAYVLHALDGEQAAEFEHLMATSETLRAEVTELSDTAVELGLAIAPETPPAALRERLLEQIATTPQAAAVAPVREGRAERKAQQRWFRRPIAAVLTAAAAAVLIAGGVTATVLTTTSSSPISVIEAASDVQHRAQPIDGGGTATVMWSHKLAKAGVVVVGVPALATGKTYELWYIGKSGARPAGTFDHPGDIMLDGAMRNGDTIGLTVEPSGGSPKPTTDPILAVST